MNTSTDTTPTTARAYLFADPASHSLSPFMHGAAFRAAGLPGVYHARRVTREELSEALQALREPGVLGANLSLPHKESAVPLLDSLSEAAQAIGAVNTVIHRDGQLIGENTDAPGLLAALQDAEAPQGPAVVLGAGGAARAAVWALKREGRDVWVWNRTHDKAARLAHDFEAQAAPLPDIPWEAVRVLVNATSAGLGAPEELPVPFLPALARGTLVYDMVYKPRVTRLMREARDQELRAENGLGMLAHQARLSFAAWTGRDVPVRVFLNAATTALD